MKLFDGCLLACDLDGTLVFGDKVPERNKSLIKYFTDEGGIFSVATGRSILAVDCVLEGLDFIGPSVFTNGSFIFDYSKKETLHQYVIDKQCNSVIKKVIEMNEGVGIEAHSDGKVYVAKNSTAMQLHTDYEEIDVIYTTVDDVIKMPLNKVLFIPDNQECVAEITETLKELNLNCDFINSSATMYGEFYVLIEMLPKNVNKAVALEFLKNKFSIEKGNFFAIGDYYNDMAMIKAADIGAATDEAPDEVKATADFVAGTASCGAVADFIEYLIELKKGC